MKTRNRPPVPNSAAPVFGASYERASTIFAGMKLVSLPWVGKSYAEEAPRIMTLFESNNYVFDEREPDTQSKLEWNIGLASKSYNSTEKVTFLTKVSRTVNKLFFHEEKSHADILDRIVYYNYLQRFLPSNRGEPEPQWVWESAGPFLSVIDVLKPDLIVSFSRGRVRRWLYNLAEQQRISAERRAPVERFEPFKLGHSWVLNTSHPSGSFSYDGAVADLGAQLQTIHNAIPNLCGNSRSSRRP